MYPTHPYFLTTIKQYDVHGIIEQSPLYVSYLAQHRKTRQYHVVKVISANLTADRKARRYFQPSLAQLQLIRHEQLVPITAVGHDSRLTYLSMDLLDGGTVQQRMKVRQAERQKLPSLHDLMTNLVGLAAALDSVHRLGMVHGDVRPANLWVDSVGRIYLSDVGLARLVWSHFSAAHYLLPQGWASPLYISPEQCDSQPPQFASDQYALGIIAFVLLTGASPFSAGEEATFYQKHLQEKPRPLTQFRPDISPAVDDVMARVLAKSPQARFPTVSDFAAALRDALSGGEADPNADSRFLTFAVPTQDYTKPTPTMMMVNPPSYPPMPFTPFMPYMSQGAPPMPIPSAPPLYANPPAAPFDPAEAETLLEDRPMAAAPLEFPPPPPLTLPVAVPTPRVMGESPRRWYQQRRVILAFLIGFTVLFLGMAMVVILTSP